MKPFVIDIPKQITLGTRAAVEAANTLGGFINTQLYPCERGNRKYTLGQKLELFGLQEYPEFNGEIVEITGYRESEQNGYYIKSDNNKVADYLNFVWEKRLRPISK